MVSIILVTYNRADWLRYSIEDILSQDFKDFELIICDDASPDNTEEICTHYKTKDSRIKYYRQRTNLKMPENLNFGIRQAKYEYIAILHDGDRFPKELIGCWYNALNSNASAGFVFSPLATYNLSGDLIANEIEFKSGLLSGKGFLINHFFNRWRYNSPVWGEAMVRKGLLEKAGCFKSEYDFYSDVDLWMTLLQNYDCFYETRCSVNMHLKEVLPNQFDNNMLRVYFLLRKIHKIHRRIAFKKASIVHKTFYFFKYSILSFCNYIYRLLVVLKYSPTHYRNARSLIPQTAPIHFLIWFLFLPVLFVFNEKDKRKSLQK